MGFKVYDNSGKERIAPLNDYKKHVVKQQGQAASLFF